MVVFDNGGALKFLENLVLEEMGVLMRPQEAVVKSESFMKPKWEEERRTKRREVDSSTEKRERLGKIKKFQEVGCNCKKSKCLKMYCECFNLQILCG